MTDNQFRYLMYAAIQIAALILVGVVAIATKDGGALLGILFVIWLAYVTRRLLPGYDHE
jgi:hypothetical protein